MNPGSGKLTGFFSVFAAILFASASFASMPQKIVGTALTMKGGVYGWGADDPAERTFDCWSFVDWVYRTSFGATDGVHSPKRYDDSDLMWIYWDDPDELLPGDILANGGEHSKGFHGAIYIGGGMTMEARGRNYGIGSWSVEGPDPYAPHGQTGYRFCYYSLLARLWTHPKPDFVYAYIKNAPEYVFGGEPYELEIVCNLPDSSERYSLKVEVFDYVHPDRVLESKTLKGITGPGTKRFGAEFVSLPEDAAFVFYRVELIDSGGKEIFGEGTRTGKATQVM